MSTKTNTALLIIDMQNYFEPMANKALPDITKLSHFFRTHSLPQFLTQHGHPPSDFQPPITNQLVRKWGTSGSIHMHTHDWELIPSISNLSPASDPFPVIHKNTYDAFWNTPLHEQLEEMGVSRVVICGVMTDCCCDNTGRSAFNRGWETWMVRDACASVDGRQHEAGLRGWEFGFGEVLGAEKVMGRLAGEMGG